MDTYYIEIIGWDYLMKYLRNGESLGLVLRYLDEDEEKDLIDKMGWQSVLDCIQTPKDLSHVLLGLNFQNETDFVNQMSKEKIRSILPFKEMLDVFCSRQLGPEDAKLLKEKYE